MFRETGENSGELSMISQFSLVPIV